MRWFFLQRYARRQEWYHSGVTDDDVAWCRTVAIRAVMRKRLPVDMDDAIQEGHLAFLGAEARFDGRGDLRGWAIRRIEGAVVDLARRESGSTRSTAKASNRIPPQGFADYPVELLASRAPGPEEQLGAREPLGVLEGRLLLVATRYYLEGWTLEEIGHELEITESRVCHLRTRADALMREF